jgi:hypothetical protein
MLNFEVEVKKASGAIKKHGARLLDTTDKENRTGI